MMEINKTENVENDVKNKNKRKDGRIKTVKKG